MFSLLASNLTRLLIPMICSSAASSIVITRSSSSMNSVSALRNVVLPEPVPPEINMLYLALISFLRKDFISSLMELNSIKRFNVIGSLENLLIDITLPSIAIGGRTIFTLEPSESRVSTIGVVSFIT